MRENKNLVLESGKGKEFCPSIEQPRVPAHFFLFVDGSSASIQPAKLDRFYCYVRNQLNPGATQART